MSSQIENDVTMYLKSFLTQNRVRKLFACGSPTHGVNEVGGDLTEYKPGRRACNDHQHNQVSFMFGSARLSLGWRVDHNMAL